VPACRPLAGNGNDKGDPCWSASITALSAAVARARTALMREPRPGGDVARGLDGRLAVDDRPRTTGRYGVVVAPSRLTGGLALAAAPAALLAVAASAATTVVGGTPIRVQAAPWSVFVEVNVGSARDICTGSVVDASHVVTAAHCLFGSGGARVPAAAVSVRAGVSNFSTPLASDREQDRAVSTVRVHPAYVWTGRPAPDDVAVLALSSPLRLGGLAVRAVALPTSGSRFPAGAAVGLAGFGRQHPTTASTGPLDWMTATVGVQGECGAASGGLIENNAILLCASSRAGAVCSGDSGSGLVTTGGTPTLVGVASAASTACRPGSQSLFTYTGAAEILRFIRGDNRPPTAPRQGGRTWVDLRWRPPLVAGDAVSCTTGGWDGQPSFSYSFVRAQGGKVLQSGPRATYVVPAAAVGTAIFCEVAASNSGGTTLERTGAARVGPARAGAALRGARSSTR
jgi:hypothetical protein